MSSGPIVPRVHVRDLGDCGDKEELRRVFSKYGSLINVWIANNPPGFAYIFFKSFEDAEKAVEAMDGKKVCGVRVRVELSPIEDRRRISRGGRSGGDYDSRDNYGQRGGGGGGRGRGRYDDYSRRGSGGGGRGNYDNYGDNYDDRHRGRGRGGYRNQSNYHDSGHGYGDRNKSGGRDYGENYGPRGGRGGGYNSGRGGYGFGGRNTRGFRGGRGGGYRDNYDSGGSRDNYYDDYYPRGRGRGRGRYNKQDYSGGGGKKDYNRGNWGYDEGRDDRHGPDIEYRQHRVSRRDDYESKGMHKREGSGPYHNKYSSKGEYRSSGGGHYKGEQYSGSRWDEYDDDDDGDYRDRSPHQKSHHGFQRPPKSRSQSRSSLSRTPSSSRSRSPSSLSPLPPPKHSSQKHRKAPRESDYRSSSHSSPPPSKSRYEYSSNIPSAYRDSYEMDTYRNEPVYESHQYGSESHRGEYSAERSVTTRSYEVKNGKRSVESRELRELDYRDEDRPTRFVVKERHGVYSEERHRGYPEKNQHRSYSNERRGGYVEKERHGGYPDDKHGGYSDREYASHSDLGDISPVMVPRGGGHRRSNQKRKRLVMIRSRG